MHRVISCDLLDWIAAADRLHRNVGFELGAVDAGRPGQSLQKRATAGHQLTVVQPRVGAVADSAGDCRGRALTRTTAIGAAGARPPTNLGDVGIEGPDKPLIR